MSCTRLKLGAGSLGLAIAFAFAACELAAAQQILKQEPAMGALREGERVLVDDGTCGPGKIKEVVGGNHIMAGGTKNISRVRRCIPRR